MQDTLLAPLDLYEDSVDTSCIPGKRPNQPQFIRTMIKQAHNLLVFQVLVLISTQVHKMMEQIKLKVL